MCYKMAKLNGKKRGKSLFYKEKSLVGLTPADIKFFTIFSEEKNRDFGTKFKVLKSNFTIILIIND